MALFAHMVSMSTGELRVDGNHARYELRMPTYEAAHVQNPDRSLLEHIRFTSGGASGRVLRVFGPHEVTPALPRLWTTVDQRPVPGGSMHASSALAVETTE